MRLPPPDVPWQITGNHWLCVPCIHPRDASIHLASVISARTRSSIEFAGDSDFLRGNGPPLVQIALSIDGATTTPGASRMVWERELSWLPTFSCTLDDIVIRGTYCSPCGRSADLPVLLISLAVENRGSRSRDVMLGISGRVGHCQSRIQSARPIHLESAVAVIESSIVARGSELLSPGVVVFAAADSPDAAEALDTAWSVKKELTLQAGASAEECFILAAGADTDGALATIRVTRRRGWRALLDTTRQTLREIQQSSSEAAVERLINRNLVFAYFTGIARAIDDGRLYPMRSRVPWNGRGITVNEWETLVWLMPALQLAHPATARETLLRMCELCGAQPGAGVRYIDGAVLEEGVSLEGIAAYPIAADEYIVASGDDRIVDEPLLAETLYGAHEDLERCKHPRLPLYSTELNPDGSKPQHRFTMHGNAAAAFALEVLSRTLDEKTAEKVQDAEAVRASALRHFTVEGTDGRARLVSSSNLDSEKSSADDPAASMYWLPFFHLIGRDDSRYRRTVKQWESAMPEELVARCGRLIGPNTNEILEWLRRAPLDNGIAAEFVDKDGRATGNGGDAALSGMVAYLAWYAVHALGAKL